MKKNVLKLAGGILMGLAVFSCSKDEVEINATDALIDENSYKNEEIYLSLLEQGYTENDIEVFGDYYVVEGDMVYKKGNAYVNETTLKATNSSQLRSHDGNTQVGNVKFYILPGILNDEDYYPAFLEAMNSWNDVLRDIELSITTNRDEATTDVKFVSEAETEEEATFLGYYFTSVTTGLAQIGRPGNPGNDIWLKNTDYSINCYLSNDETRQNDIRETIVHEIGHVLGFAHTGSTERVHVEGTIDQDEHFTDHSKRIFLAGSIMNPIAPCFNAPMTFSEHDIKGIENIYGMPESDHFDIDQDSVNFELMEYPEDYTMYGYISAKYGNYLTNAFDGSFEVTWRSSIAADYTPFDYLRVEIYLYPKSQGSFSLPSEWTKTYDKWIHKANLIDRDGTTEFGIKVPSGHYDYENYRQGRIILSAAEGAYSVEVEEFYLNTIKTIDGNYYF